MILVAHKEDAERKLLVYFPDENKRVGVKPIRVLAEKMSENAIQHAILVVRQTLTPFAKSAIAETLSKMRIEVGRTPSNMRYSWGDRGRENAIQHAILVVRQR